VHFRLGKPQIAGNPDFLNCFERAQLQLCQRAHKRFRPFGPEGIFRPYSRIIVAPGLNPTVYPVSGSQIAQEALCAENKRFIEKISFPGRVSSNSRSFAALRMTNC
jgi:protein-disulfide isomerase